MKRDESTGCFNHIIWYKTALLRVDSVPLKQSQAVRYGAGIEQHAERVDHCIKVTVTTTASHLVGKAGTNEQKTVLIGQPPFKRLYFNRSCQFHPLIRIRWGFGAASSSCHVPSRPDRTEPSSPVHALPLRDRCSRWRYHPDGAV